MIASTFAVPYYAVIFTSLRTLENAEGYAQTAQRMIELAMQQPGFLGVESARGEDGLGITVSYWRDEASILAWKHHAEHSTARDNGREQWYSAFTTRICKVQRDYAFGA